MESGLQHQGRGHKDCKEHEQQEHAARPSHTEQEEQNRKAEAEVRITIYSPEGITIVVGAAEVDIETKHGLVGDSIPSEEWSQGFKFKENTHADNDTTSPKD